MLTLLSDQTHLGTYRVDDGHYLVDVVQDSSTYTAWLFKDNSKVKICMFSYDKNYVTLKEFMERVQEELSGQRQKFLYGRLNFAYNKENKDIPLLDDEEVGNWQPSYVDFISLVCDILDIATVSMEAVTKSKMKVISSSPDTLACFDKSIYKIYILKESKPTKEGYYHLAHELRHAWQSIMNDDLYFGDYTDEMSEDQYHNNIAEIDANAFAAIAMAKIFGLVTERTYSDAFTQKLYNNRLKKLQKEYGIKFPI